MDIKYILHRRLVESNLKSAELASAVSAWVDYPSNVEFKGSRSPGKRVVTYTLNFVNQPDSVGWGILLGELAHSLRSSLDNVIFNLSSAQTDKNEFPIFNDSVRYPVAAQKKLEGITDTAILQFIKDKQPFNSADPDTNPLYLLHQINNADKHRLPKIVLFHPSEIDANLSIEFESNICEPQIVFNERPIESGIWFMKYKFRYPFRTFTDNTRFSLQARVEINGRQFGVRELCDSMVAEVHGIVNYLGGRLH